MTTQRVLYKNNKLRFWRQVSKYVTRSYFTAHFINFDVRECQTNKYFCNKIWQATKFAKMWTEQVREAGNLSEVKPENLPNMDRWILSRMSDMVVRVNAAFENYDFNIATSCLKNFLYYDFCDVYLVSSIDV